jgi:serine/threonine protein kinase
MPPTQIGAYRIIRPIGQGGMGAVYEAIQEPIKRRVAIKVLLPQYVEDQDVLNRFFNEARVVNLIEHPSIVQVSDYGQAPDGTAYLVMEYLRGETLSSRLDRLHRAGERMGVIEAVQSAAQIADALCAAHEKSVVHRDLKPANIIIVRDSAVQGGERAKILDFGIAKLTQGQTHGTATNAVMGTPQYMSPEQCRGAGSVDDKTDVYALGVMLYEMLAGRRPFLAQSAIEYMSQHLFQEPPPLGDVAPTTPADLVALVHRLLSKDKTARPPMSELSTELVRLLAQLSGVTSAAAPVEIEVPGTAPYVVQSAFVSTLGASQGQRLQPATQRRARALTMLPFAAGMCLFVIAAVFFGWIRPHPATLITPASMSPRMPPPTASPAAVMAADSPLSPPSLVSAPAPTPELQKPPDNETLEPPKQAPRPQQKAPATTSLAVSARAEHPPHSHVLKPPRTANAAPSHRSTKRSHLPQQPPPPAQPDSSTKRAQDYEP